MLSVQHWPLLLVATCICMATTEQQLSGAAETGAVKGPNIDLQKTCNADSTHRAVCGWWGILESECRALGCCFASSSAIKVPWCFQKSAANRSIEPRTTSTTTPAIESMYCAEPDAARLQCGYVGILLRACHAAGCCFDSGTSGCFHRRAVSTSTTTIATTSPLPQSSPTSLQEDTMTGSANLRMGKVHAGLTLTPVTTLSSVAVTADLANAITDTTTVTTRIARITRTATTSVAVQAALGGHSVGDAVVSGRGPSTTVSRTSVTYGLAARQPVLRGSGQLSDGRVVKKGGHHGNGAVTSKTATTISPPTSFIAVRWDPRAQVLGSPSSEELHHRRSRAAGWTEMEDGLHSGSQLIRPPAMGIWAMTVLTAASAVILFTMTVIATFITVTMSHCCCCCRRLIRRCCCCCSPTVAPKGTKGPPPFPLPEGTGRAPILRNY